MFALVFIPWVAAAVVAVLKHRELRKHEAWLAEARARIEWPVEYRHGRL